jgi:hypothetical protein
MLIKIAQAKPCSLTPQCIEAAERVADECTGLAAELRENYEQG